MNKTNENYFVRFRGERFTEEYYRDPDGWVKISARGRTFRCTAEQVLNHLLPALCFGQVDVSVTHTDEPYWRTLQRGTSDV